MLGWIKLREQHVTTMSQVMMLCVWPVLNPLEIDFMERHRFLFCFVLFFEKLGLAFAQECSGASEGMTQNEVEDKLNNFIIVCKYIDDKTIFLCKNASKMSNLGLICVYGF